MEKKKAILKLTEHESHIVFDFVQSWQKDLLNPLFNFCDENKNGFVQCEFSEPHKARTNDQNSKWWAMCTEYGCYLGMSKDEVALGVKYRAMEEGLWRGVPVPFSKNGEMQPVSTMNSDTQEMSILIEVLSRIAAEDGYLFQE